jgi:hypothetical protein
MLWRISSASLERLSIFFFFFRGVEHWSEAQWAFSNHDTGTL